jgi:hypothetical protein
MIRVRNAFRPIVSERRISRVAALLRPPAPEPGIALVLHQDGRDLVVLRQSSQVFGRGEAMRGVTRVYRVDLTAHRLRYVLAAPCSGDAVSFEVTAEVTCRVRDPRAIVEQRVEDAAAAVEPFVAGQVHAISRRYSYTQVDEAESRCAEALEELAGAAVLEDALLIERTRVWLRIDDEVRRSLHRGEVLEAQGRARGLATQHEVDRLQALFDRRRQWLGSIEGAAGAAE